MDAREQPSRILVIDDDPSACALVEMALGASGHKVETRSDAQSGLQAIDQSDFDVVLTDLHLQGTSGLELCERFVALRPDLPVIVITAFGSLETAVAAIRAGAYDYITKPIDMRVLGIAVERALDHAALRQELTRLRSTDEAGFPRIVGDSPLMRKTHDLVSRVAPSAATVLITGESGTGKELVARSIHEESPRAHRRFVAVNCGAMPASLLESELFGHVQGAFTDAKETRPGLFIEADGGTLFLDEIGDMPSEMQVKLLRVLQEGKVRPVGGSEERNIDVRILAATNRDLEALVEAGQFREDLFYRINVVQIEVPPLRLRGTDVLDLVHHFVEVYARRSGRPVRGVAEPAARRLLDYDWPGNVRELQNVIERAVTLTQFDQVTVEDLPTKIQNFERQDFVIADDHPDQMPSMEEIETRYIKAVMRATGGNKTRASRILGLDRRTLYRKLERLDEHTD
ncbi:MAG: sigma-54 dependent transcriptional regulator [Myxococcota bacterium]